VWGQGSRLYGRFIEWGLLDPIPQLNNRNLPERKIVISTKGSLLVHPNDELLGQRNSPDPATSSVRLRDDEVCAFCTKGPNGGPENKSSIGSDLGSKKHRDAPAR
jgi:hypothetical protein